MSNKLTECDDCGGQVSRRAATCPHCGAPRTPEKSPVHLTEVEEEEDQDAIDERRHNEVERILESKKAKPCKYCKAPLAPTTKTCPRCGWGSDVLQQGIFGIVLVVFFLIFVSVISPFVEVLINALFSDWIEEVRNLKIELIKWRLRSQE